MDHRPSDRGTVAPADLSAGALAAAYERRDISPVEAVQACLDRIAADDIPIGAFCLVDKVAALDAARASERRWAEGEPLGPLDGVPVAVKDLLLTKGWPTRRGSLLIDPDQAWPDDAPSVARLRDQGAVLVGKTTTSEMGWKAVGDNPLNGTTRNPVDLKRTPGGSSAGSAAALAARMVPLALGTDAGGSVRIPAAFTGTVALKPTHGRVPSWPPSPFSSLSNVGPMARSVGDVALLLGAIAGEDPLDWWSRGAARVTPVEPFADLRGLRVAVSLDLGHATVDPEVRRSVELAAEVFATLGAQVDHIDVRLPDVSAAFGVIWSVAVATGLANIDEAQRRLLDPGLAETAEIGDRHRGTAHASAEVARHAYANAMGQIFTGHDLLLTPTVPIVAFPIDHDSPGRRHDPDWSRWAPFSHPFNLTGHPALSVPCGVTAEGLPVGLQVVGRHGEDERVLAAGWAYESARGPVMPALPPTG